MSLSKRKSIPFTIVLQHKARHTDRGLVAKGHVQLEVKKMDLMTNTIFLSLVRYKNIPVPLGSLPTEKISKEISPEISFPLRKYNELTSSFVKTTKFWC